MAYLRLADSLPAPSVADAKGRLSEWGDATEISVADLRSRVNTGAASLAVILGIGGIAIFAACRLLPRRNTTSRAQLDRACAHAVSLASSATVPATHQRSIGKSIGRMIVTRLGLWLMPHVVQAARRGMTGKSKSNGRP